MTYFDTKKGEHVSLLGYGAMRLPMSGNDYDQTKIDTQVARMLDFGVNLFDTSPCYCRGESERRLGEALAKSGASRSDYFLSTKLSNFAPVQYPLAECKKMFFSSLEFLRTDYLDFYHLHSIGNNGFETFSKRYLENGALDWCMELREQGKIRNLGFSFHGDPKTFDWCLDNFDKYRWNFCLIQMNYVDWLHAKEINPRNLNAEYLYRRLTEKGIPAMVMEPLLGGRLARFNYAIARELKPLAPDDSLASWAFRFIASHPNVMTILSGMTRDEDIEENVKTLSPLKKCSPTELAALERAACAMLKLDTIPCNRCNYCMPCPYGLDIPALLTFRNEFLAARDRGSAAQILSAYAKAIPEELRRADHCTGCGICNSHCPQQIDIPREIANIDSWIDALKDEEISK